MAHTPHTLPNDLHMLCMSHPLLDLLLLILLSLIRHSGTPDNLMAEIPTVVLDPMPASLLEHGSYVVLNRPYAVSAIISISWSD